MSKKIILSVQGISKTFSGMPRPALQNITFDVEQGQIIGISGNSGSGKTTLLRIIGGFEAPSGGSLMLRDTLIADSRSLLPPEDRGIGVVFQDYVLFPHLTVRQNILFGISHLTKKQQEFRLHELLALVQLEEVLHSLPHELSGGQMQRVALARALAPHPSIILFDEPFNSLDVLLKDQLIAATQEILKRHNVAALFVTHDREEAFHMTDRIIMLHEGAILQDAATRVLYECPASHLVASFFGKINIIPAERQSTYYTSALGAIPFHNMSPAPRHECISLMIRPHHLHLVAHREEGLAFKVKTIKFLGTYQELCMEADSQDIIVHTDPLEKINPQHLYHIEIRSKKIFHLPST